MVNSHLLRSYWVSGTVPALDFYLFIFSNPHNNVTARWTLASLFYKGSEMLRHVLDIEFLAIQNPKFPG